jgi:hypothetical protein
VSRKKSNLSAEAKNKMIRDTELALSNNGIAYSIMNVSNMHFHCFNKHDGKLYQFWPQRGAIYFDGIDKMLTKPCGIDSLIALCSENNLSKSNVVMTPY